MTKLLISTFSLNLFYFICIFHTVETQCTGSPLALSVGYETVTVTPPGYRNGYATNLNCAWNLTSIVSGADLLFRVTDITLNCAGDAINVYDGKSSSGTNIHSNECQSGSSPRYLSYKTAATGNVYATFISDSSTSASEKGFLMYAISANDMSGSGCSSRQSLIATDSEEYLTSPGFPSEYAINKDCEWIITATDLFAHVYIELKFMDIENHQNCNYDYIQMSEQGNINHTLCQEDMWKPSNLEYRSNGNNLIVKFHSDNQNGNNGFLLSYKQLVGSAALAEVNARAILILLLVPLLIYQNL